MKNDGNLLNRYLELAFNQAKELVYIKDSNMRFLVCNCPFADFFGMGSPEKATGLSASDLMPPLAAEEDLRTDKETLEKGISVKTILTFQEANGSPRMFACIKVPLIEMDHTIGVFCIMRDITNEEDIIENYRNQEAVNSAIIRNAPVGISVRDSFGNLNMYRFTTIMSCAGIPSVMHTQ